MYVRCCLRLAQALGRTGITLGLMLALSGCFTVEAELEVSGLQSLSGQSLVTTTTSTSTTSTFAGTTSTVTTTTAPGTTTTVTTTTAPGTTTTVTTTTAPSTTTTTVTTTTTITTTTVTTTTTSTTTTTTISLTLVGTTTPQAGVCQSYSLTYNYTSGFAGTLNLALSSGTGGFFSDVACTSPITSRPINIGDTGSGTFYFMSTVAESKTFSFSGAGVASSAPVVTLTSSSASVSTSYISASPETGVPADNTSTSTLTAYILDQYGNGVPNINVSFRVASGPAGTTFSGTGLTGTSGTTTRTIRANVSGTRTIRFSVPSALDQASISANVSFDAAVPGAPGAPNLVQNGGTVEIDWTASPTQESRTYSVWRRELPAGTFAAIATGLTVLEHVDSSITAPTSYEYKISVVTAGGETFSTAQGISTVLGSATLINLTSASVQFGTVGTGGANASRTRLIRLYNDGPGTIHSIGAGSLPGAYQYTGFTGFPGRGGTCGSVLPEGASCAIAITFAPGAAGPQPGVINVQYDGGAGPTQLAINVEGDAIGAGASLRVSEHPRKYYTEYGILEDVSEAYFGKIPVGSVMYRNLVITNETNNSAYGVIGMISPSTNFKFRGGAGFPGYGGNCGSTIAPGESCMVALEFTPGSVGSLSADLTVNHSDGAVVRGLNGAGTDRAIIEIFDYSSHKEILGLQSGPERDFGPVGTGFSQEHAFYVVNTGAMAASTVGGSGLPAGEFRFKGGGFPGGTPGVRDPKYEFPFCGSGILPGEKCTVVVEFAPTSVGAKSAQFGISYFDGFSGGALATRAVTGAGIADSWIRLGEMGDRGPSLFTDFGDQPTSYNSYKHVILTNVGNAPASFAGQSVNGSAFTLPSGWPGDTAGISGYPMCGSALSPGSSCLVRVLASPAAVGEHSGTLGFSYTYDSQSSYASRVLRVNGVNTAVITAIDDPYDDSESDEYPGAPFFDMGQVPSGVAASRVIFFKNEGVISTNLNFDSVFSGSAYFQGGYPGANGESTYSTGGRTYDFCASPAVLNPGDACVVRVSLPASSPGLWLSTIQFNATNTLNPTFRIRIGAVATTQAILRIHDWDGPDSSGSLSMDSFNFGTHGTSIDKVFFISNTGSQGVNVSPVLAGSSNFSWPGGFPGTSTSESLGSETHPPCTTSIGPATKCAMRVRFFPSGTGVHNATLRLYPDSGVYAAVDRALTATATLGGYFEVSRYTNLFNSCSSGTCGPFDWGTQSTSTVQTFYVNHTGAGFLTLSSSDWSGSGFTMLSAFDGVGSQIGGVAPCGPNLPAQTSCYFQVRFDGAGGSFSKTFRIQGGGMSRDVEFRARTP